MKSSSASVGAFSFVLLFFKEEKITFPSPPHHTLYGNPKCVSIAFIIFFKVLFFFSAIVLD